MNKIAQEQQLYALNIYPAIDMSNLVEERVESLTEWCAQNEYKLFNSLTSVTNVTWLLYRQIRQWCRSYIYGHGESVTKNEKHITADCLPKNQLKKGNHLESAVSEKYYGMYSNTYYKHFLWRPESKLLWFYRNAIIFIWIYCSILNLRYTASCFLISLQRCFHRLNFICSDTFLILLFDDFISVCLTCSQYIFALNHTLSRLSFTYFFLKYFQKSLCLRLI